MVMKYPVRPASADAKANVFMKIDCGLMPIIAAINGSSAKARQSRPNRVEFIVTSRAQATRQAQPATSKAIGVTVATKLPERIRGNGELNIGLTQRNPLPCVSLRYS